MTLYSAALHLVGLSHSEAADLHGVRLDTVKSWSSGRNGVPQGVWDDLRDLYETQQAAIDAALETIDTHPEADAVDLLTGTGRSAEWPSEGAHMATLAAVALLIDKPVS